VFVVLGALVQGFLVNGHVNAIISTIEKRFDLSSTESGLIASCYDIGACVAILSVTYIGAHGHKPLWVGWGVFLIGVSGILFSLPHFTAPMYTYTLTNNTCGASEIAECSVNSARSHRYAIWFFYLAFIIAGFGGAPLYSLGITYMDENLSHLITTNSPLTIPGILVTGSIIGPGIGFLVGGAFLGVYTYPEEQVAILDSNEAWVGAWWMGALIVGCIGVLSSLPILMLPRTLPGTHHHRQNRGQDIGSVKTTSIPGYKPCSLYQGVVGVVSLLITNHHRVYRYRDFPKCVLVLLRNPVFVLVSIAGAVDSILISGLATFGAKYIETIFGLSATDAGIAFGALALVGAAGGQLLGGGLITKFNIRMTWILRMTYMAPVVTWFLSAGFIISCSDILFAGVSTQYHDASPSGGSFVSTCNLNCGCDLNVYKPVCGADGITYYSACFAGCSAVGTAGNTYENCTCVSATTGVATNISSATTGVCSGSGCGAGGMFALFCILMFLFMVFTFLNEASALQASLRCVAFNQRSFAIGVQWLIIRLIGTIPGPLIIGAVFDRNCAQWSLNCGEKGSCSTYN
uniref:Solute carrier organic anion transporter family member n=1 Tax=Ciona savignyi TaxID=51511 RepID=H2Y4M9_CIOSA